VGRPCEACRHPRNRDIDRALANEGRAEQLARKYGLSLSSMQRHRRNHLKPDVATMLPITGESADYETWLEHAKLESASDVLGFARFLIYRLDRLVSRAEADGDVRGAISAITGMQKSLTDLFARTTGLLTDAPQIDASTKVVAVLGNLSEGELRAFLGAQGALKAGSE